MHVLLTSMPATKLDKWFVKKDGEGEKVEPLFSIFFLDGESMKATWERQMPKKHTYSVTVKWSSLSEDVTIVTNIGSTDSDKFEHFVFPSETIYNNVPYLKSHLQKCIRRSNPNLALKTAMHLARLDLQELLRRLAIIVVEDAILIPEFSTLVWLTAAVSKGFCLDKKRVYWLFGLVYKLATINIKDTEIFLSNQTPTQTETKTKMTVAVSTSKTAAAAKVSTPTLKQAKLNYGGPVTKPAEIVAPLTKTPEIAKGVSTVPRVPAVPTVTAVPPVVGTTPGLPLNTITKIPPKDKDWKKWKIYKLSDDDKSIIQTLLFRESYGGMKGDKNMLIDVASKWFDRFMIASTVKLEQTSLNPINNNNMDKALLFYREQETLMRTHNQRFSRLALGTPLYISPPEENLRLDEWILAAIDFHVVNNIIMILADKYETLTYEDIKEAIWTFSSAYTNKDDINPIAKKNGKSITTDKFVKTWNTIRPEFYSLAAYFLKNNH
jgi:hypothetical protein